MSVLVSVPALTCSNVRWVRRTGYMAGVAIGVPACLSVRDSLLHSLQRVLGMTGAKLGW